MATEFDIPTYDYWHAALEGKPGLEIDQNSPQPGFYRMKDGTPVAIWAEEDKVVLMAADRIVAVDDHEDVWTRCATRAVTEQQWHDRNQNGFWYDEDPAVSETTGHNIRNANDQETLADLIARLGKAVTADYGRIDDDEKAARAQSLRARLLELKNKADGIWEKLKAPHLEAGRAVDATWQPLVKSAEAFATSLRSAMSAHETRKLQEQRRREEMQRQEEEEARRLGAIEDGAIPQEQPGPAPSEPIRGGYGRAASRQIRHVVTGIAQDMLPAFSRYAGNEEVRALLIKLAQRDVDQLKLTELKGFIVTEEVAVR